MPRLLGILDGTKGPFQACPTLLYFNSLDSEEEEVEEVNQLVLNRRRREQLVAAPIVPIAALVVPVATPIVPILVSSLDLKDSDDLAFAQPQPVGKDVIALSYSECYGSNTSSDEVNMAPRFRTRGKKRCKSWLILVLC